MLNKITILGAGNWGLTIALLLARKEKRVTVWGRNEKFISEISRTRANSRYLPGISLPEEIEFTSDFEEAITDKNLIILGVPSHALRQIAQKILDSKIDVSKTYFLDLAKGIENGTLKRASEILFEILPETEKNYAVLAGPNIAKEVALKIPTTTVISSKNPTLASEIQQTISTNYFRAYANDDIIGVELGGALKNVIALAAGISDGLGFGANAKSALMTRGLAEISRLGEALGANPETFAGLSGMGDLITTCVSPSSRNRTLGEKIGKGKTLTEALEEMTMVAEGVNTTKSAFQLSQKLKIEMPITSAIHSILFEERNPKEVVAELMLRNLKAE